MTDEALAAVRPKLAIALDVDDLILARRLAAAVSPYFGVAKVGLELFSASGRQGLEEYLREREGFERVSVHVDDVRHSVVRLSWQAPSDPLLHIDVYEVKYYEIGSNESNTVITKKDAVEIKNLKKQTDYAFQIRAQTSKGWGAFSQPIFGKTKDDSDPVNVRVEEDAMQPGVAVAIVVAVLFVIIVCCLLFFFVKRNNDEKRKPKDSDSLDYRGIDNQFSNESHPIVQTHTLPPIYNPFALHKTYVDPHTYEDPNVAVKQFAKEIDSKYITIEAIIGGGEFGEVCKGKLSVPDRQDMTVAIKTLKSGSSDKAKIDFLTEASIMGQFEHPNVIFLQGVVTKANPIMIITEYMENGSLDTFLRANDGKFQVRRWNLVAKSKLQFLILLYILCRSCSWWE